MKLLVAGIGNIFLGDDAFGVEVARRLAERPLPEGVRVVDYGIRSYDLAYALMDGWDQVILVDAVPRGGQPGTIYVIEPDLEQLGEPNLDAHSMDPVAVLQLVRALGGEVKRMLVVGCEPANIDASESGGFGLSAPVEAAVEEAIRAVEEIIQRKIGSGAAAA
jgi:hydrogenase maturation protease